MPERPRPRPAAVEARAPTRIDLAGGTIDLWPLYLLHDHPLTVNAAIDIEARARVETTGEEGVEIVSRDLDARWRAGSAAELAIPPGRAPVPLEFPRRLAAHFLDGEGAVACRVTT